MTDKERIETIKRKRVFETGSEKEFVRVNDIIWLIEQAERALKNAEDLEVMDRQLASEQKRVRELEKRIENLNELTDMQHEQNLRFYRQLNQLIRTNQRYKKALGYIRELAEYDEYENTVEQVYNCTKKALEETE